MRRLCTICARGGSKGVEGKNSRSIAGLPLLAHTLAHAIESHRFDAIAVSSDSDEILDIGSRYGADVLVQRPIDLATDSAPKLPVIRHCVETAEQLLGWSADVVIDLDVTAPLRVPADIRGALDLLESGDASNVITGVKARRSPYFNLVELDAELNAHLSKTLEEDIVRRQDAPACFDMNASIYVWWRASLFNGLGLFQPRTRLYEMPEERSVDIDSDFDWKVVEFLLANRTG